MRIFTNKQFQRVLEKEIAPLKQENEGLRKKIADKEFYFCKKIQELEKHYAKVIPGIKGGYILQIKRLKNRLKKAEEKLSQRYIVKELKPQKSKNMQIMKSTNHFKTSQIIKKVVE